LSLLPFRVVQRAVVARSKRSTRADAMPAQRIAWAVATVSRYVPRATCLTQAFAGTIILAAHDHDATLRLGVAKDDDGKLRAHAWIECEGRAILGETRDESFVVLPPLRFDR
jgi:hypothetical protein